MSDSQTRSPAERGPQGAIATRDRRAGELSPPVGLAARTVMLADVEYLVLSIPFPSWEIPDSLSEAEASVALATLRGDSNKAIARGRGTSVHTVANQISRIFAKLGVASRIELARRRAARHPGSSEEAALRLDPRRSARGPRRP